MQTTISKPLLETTAPNYDLQVWLESLVEADDDAYFPESAARPVELARVNKRFQPAVEWIEQNVFEWDSVPRTGAGYDFQAPDVRRLSLDQYQKDILNHVLTPRANGRFPYRTVFWSQPKKHGKTQVAGAVCAWWTDQIEPPNLVLAMASSQESSAGLIFGSTLPTFAALGSRVPLYQTSKPEVRHTNGSTFRAIPSDHKGQAGQNYGLTAFSELWTYTTERDRKLWNELTHVPTKQNSMRWVETYCGFEDSSELLKEQFLRVFTDLEETDVCENVRPVPELLHITTDGGTPCCWEIPEENLFYYLDHEIRASWLQGEIGEAFLRTQRGEMRHADFVRLWENRWQASIGGFIEPEMYDDAINLAGERYVPAVYAGDASQRNDTTSLVGVEKVFVPMFGEVQERFRVVRVRVWDPKGKDIDLDETIAAEVERLFDLNLMSGAFFYDPMQMHQVAVNLRKKKVPCVEFNQGTERLKADFHLWKLFKQRRIDIFPDAALSAHVRAAKAKQYENEQLRIIKGTQSASLKVDAAVALSMAAWKASLMRIPKPKRKSKSTSMF